MPGSELVPLNPAPGTPPLPRNLARSHSIIDLDQVDAFGQLRATWDILLKHQWLILVVTFVLTILVAVYSYKMKPVYQATAGSISRPRSPCSSRSMTFFVLTRRMTRSWQPR